MKTFTNKAELKELGACANGYKTFIAAHGDNDATLSQCLDSNGWDDVWWLIFESYIQFSDDQKHDLRLFGCKKALINIEKIKSFCSKSDYELIVGYLNHPTGSAQAAAESAAESAACAAAESAAWAAAWAAAESAACAAAWAAAESAACAAAWAAAESAALQENIKELRELFVKWESQQC